MNNSQNRIVCKTITYIIAVLQYEYVILIMSFNVNYCWNPMEKIDTYQCNSALANWFLLSQTVATRKSCSKKAPFEQFKWLISWLESFSKYRISSYSFLSLNSFLIYWGNYSNFLHKGKLNEETIWNFHAFMLVFSEI